MPSPVRIAVFGLGGVGGFCGGMLASHYESTNDVETIFIARGENARAIESRGLAIVSPETELVAHPGLVTGDARTIGPVDLLICAVKSYDLGAIDQLAPCIGPTTSILPLLNGVDARERIRSIYPSTDVWDGCIYILARLSTPGVITLTRSFNQVYFGSESAPREKLRQVEKIFKDAGITAELVEDMPRRIWEKFIFISSWATTTTFFDADMAAITRDDARMQVLFTLLNEIEAVARRVGAGLADNVVATTLRRIEGLPLEATSSMHADFQRGGRNELESLTGVVVRLGKEHGVPTPQHQSMLAVLRMRAGGAERSPS